MYLNKCAHFLNAFSVSLTKFVSSSDWLAEVARADQYLTENFQVGLLTDDDINYDDEAAERCHPVGPNAKETVRQFSQVCNKIIPDNHPPLGPKYLQLIITLPLHAVNVLPSIGCHHIRVRLIGINEDP